MRTHYERFYAKVLVGDGCWEWQAYRNKAGYGRFSTTFRDGPIPAHRASWLLEHGEIPAGFNVLHRCDNPPCIRPGHLFLGTHADNDADRDAKGRTARGERVASSKLKTEEVVAIRASSDRHEDIAKRYGVSRSLISMVKLRKVWRHLDDDGSSTGS